MTKPKQTKKKRSLWMWSTIIILIILIIGWYLCWFIVPAIPNEKCVNTCGGTSSDGADGAGGSDEDTSGSGESYSGGSSTCPTCDTCSECDECPQCDARCTYDDKYGCLTICCPVGYTWNPAYGTCGYDDQQLVVCPTYSTYNPNTFVCDCNLGYSQDANTGCCNIY